MAETLEALMLICFGVSWPFSIAKSYKARTCKGKSIVFLTLVLIGYICGIAAKLITHHITYVLAFYILDFLLVFTDTCFYFRNSKLDRLRDASEQAH